MILATCTPSWEGLASNFALMVNTTSGIKAMRISRWRWNTLVLGTVRRSTATTPFNQWFISWITRWLNETILSVSSLGSLLDRLSIPGSVRNLTPPLLIRITFFVIKVVFPSPVWHVYFWNSKAAWLGACNLYIWYT